MKAAAVRTVSARALARVAAARAAVARAAAAVAAAARAASARAVAAMEASATAALACEASAPTTRLRVGHLQRALKALGAICASRAVRLECTQLNGAGSRVQ
jgi:hypothetical protein